MRELEGVYANRQSQGAGDVEYHEAHNYQKGGRGQNGRETRGTITRRMTIQGLAPEVMAASSRLGSIFRKVGESSRKVDGVSDSPSMNIMPGKLKMLNGPA